MSTLGPDREGRLISTRLDVLVAGMCDPQRFRRGRDYARQGTVHDLDVQAGYLTASVQGSVADAYRVTVRTAAGEVGEHLSVLVPTRGDITFDCSCPDWDSPCKHAVAVMVQFSERVAHSPVLLATWRGVTPDPTTAQRATIGSRTAGSSTRAAAAPREASLTAADRAALGEFLGVHLEFEQPTLTMLAPPQGAWDEPWSSMLVDALTVLAQTPRRR